MTRLFFPSETPRVFGVAPGIDFPKALVEGLKDRTKDLPPEFIATVEIYVNTRRMARRVQKLFEECSPGFLPKTRLITELGGNHPSLDLPPAAPKLRRRLEVVQLISKLLEAEPDLAPRFSLFDLADSLVSLMEEMHGEGVHPEVLAELDVSDQSGHWDRALKFVRLIQQFFEMEAHEPDQEARQRYAAERLSEIWADTPPEHPILIAGSTGSRGATRLLMEAVAKLPQGAVLLPGFDTDLPLETWEDLADPLTSEDHPQYRFRAFFDRLNMPVSEVLTDWSAHTPPSAPRNALVSLALRPAPVTDQWLRDGPDLTDLPAACEHMTLIEAESQREEALAIALCLREAIESGTKTAALITPDRMIARRVTAALSRWGIIPDDSAGMPLPASPPGRLLRLVRALIGQPLTAEALLALLKHPLVNSGNRGQHQLWAHSLELYIRKKGGPFPDRQLLLAWAEIEKLADPAQDWVNWLFDAIEPLSAVHETSLKAFVELHTQTTEVLVNGPDAPETNPLWANDAGQVAAKVMNEFLDEAPDSLTVTTADYRSLFEGVLALGEVRNSDTPDPRVLIWGTLEARVQGADLVVLSGLNEGTWPEPSRPDPWMNRSMRQKSGLLLPERRIGLSAHDFQQAIAASEVVLTRSRKSDDAETVPSRWLNRLTNLMNGLPEVGAKTGLEGMLERGKYWLDLAEALENPPDIPKAKRPSPRPPLAARPRRISVTAVKTLIRDPYAIYAQRVLGLHSLDPLNQEPDAPLRGTLVHKILERFQEGAKEESVEQEKARLMAITDTILAEKAPWPTARALWRARIERVSDWFLDHEMQRRAVMSSVDLESKGFIEVADPQLTLTAEADRIDRDNETGQLHIFDYKTGTPPSENVQKSFDKQLLLEAAMAERGAFKKVGKSKVASATFIGLGSTPKEVSAPIEDGGIEETWEGFLKLFSAYLETDTGFTSRRAMQKSDDLGRFDHLARFGEWEISDAPNPEDLE